DHGVTGDGEVDGVREPERGAALPVPAVTARAVGRVERSEVHHLGRGEDRGLDGRTHMRLVARGERDQRRESRASAGRREAPARHARLPSSPRGAMIPGASTPARNANAMFSEVGMRSCLITTTPAVTPKATCDAMNHTQSIRLWSTGFSSPRVE